MEIEKFLRGFDIKITQPRISILKIMEISKIAISAEKIFNICKDRELKMDLSTVYRTLDMFESKGIVEKFDLGNNKYSYILKREDHKHLLECKLCHKEIEIECPMQQIEELIKNRTGFSSIEHQLKIEGICEECKLEK